jgi:hypothetical protein
MSLEITLYSKSATKLKLINFLKKEGFIKCKHILDDFNTNNYLHYNWFNSEDFTSLNGVEASVVLKNELLKENSSENIWLLQTRTRASASREDKVKQNDVIRKAKKIFGGNFENDWYGNNKYTNIEDYPLQSPLEKGLFLMYENIIEKIDKVNMYINQPDDFEDNIKDLPHSSMKKFILAQNPNRIVYNSLIPFMVSIIEHLLSNSFMLLLKYDDVAFSKLNDENIKIPLDQVLKVSNSELDIAQIITDSINFQNLSIANKAYKKYFNIDVLNIISINKSVSKRKIFLKKEIENIISLRHNMIHDFSFDYSYSRLNFLFHLNCIETFVNVFISNLESNNDLKINTYKKK